VKKILTLVLGLAAFISACGNNYSGGGTQPPPVTVSISPASVSVEPGKQVQFMATVKNATNTAVTWQVNGTTGGTSGNGTITTGGLYTAPAPAPPGPIAVTAVSQADTTVSATAMVTIVVPTGQLSISPSSVTVLAGATQQFTATASGANVAVTWQVNGSAGGSATLGTISTGGLYTAPANPPAGQKVTITAVAQSNASETATSTVTVAPSDATLNGLYAFSFKGYDANGLLIEAGSFAADGKGKITSGEEDVNSGAGVFGPVTFTGTYSVGADGRASLLLNPPASSGFNPETYDLVLTSNAHARMIRYDAYATGIGSADLQDSSAFNTAALKGNLVVSLDGVDTSGMVSSTAAIGLLTFDGTGKVSTGMLDANNNGSTTTANPVSGTYSVDSPASNGRGLITVSGNVGTFDFVFYIVDAGQIKLISTDTSPVWGGTAQLQTSSSFTSASLHGNTVYLVQGETANGAVVDAGRFTSTSAGALSNGVGDENSNGTVTPGYAFTGTYSISSNGHGTLQIVNGTLGTYNYSLYLTGDNQGVLLRTDPSAATIGVIDGQTQPAFALPDINHLSFGFTLDGLASNGPVDKLGQVSLATGKGTEDVNLNSTLNSNIAVTTTETLGSNGVGTLTVSGGGSTRSIDLYAISPKQILMIGLDSDQVLWGGAEQQFP
jgi:plastocyanin